MRKLRQRAQKFRSRKEPQNPQVSSAKELINVGKTSGKEMSKIGKHTLPSSMTDLAEVSGAGPNTASDFGKIKNHLLMNEQCLYNIHMKEPHLKESSSLKLLCNMTKTSADIDATFLQKHKQMKELAANQKSSLKESDKVGNLGAITDQRRNLQMKEVYVKKTDSAKELYKVGKPRAITDHTLYEKPIRIKELCANETGLRKEQCNITKPCVRTDRNERQQFYHMKDLTAHKPGITKELCKVRKASTSSDCTFAQKTELFNSRKPESFSVPPNNKIIEICAKKMGPTEDSINFNEALASPAIGPNDKTKKQIKELCKYRMQEHFKIKRSCRKRKISELKEPSSDIISEARKFSTNIREQSLNKEVTTYSDTEAKAIKQFRSNEDEGVKEMKNRKLMQLKQTSSYNRHQRRPKELGFTEFRSIEQSYSSRMAQRIPDKNCAVEPLPQTRKQTPMSTVTDSTLKIKKQEESSNIKQKQRPCCTINNANRESYFGTIRERFDSDIPDELYYRNFRKLCSDSQEDRRQGTREQWTVYSCM